MSDAPSADGRPQTIEQFENEFYEINVPRFFG